MDRILSPEEPYRSHRKSSEAFERSKEALERSEKDYDEILKKARVAGDLMFNPGLLEDASGMYQEWARREIARSLERGDTARANELAIGLEHHLNPPENIPALKGALPMRELVKESDGRSYSIEYSYDDNSNVKSRVLKNSAGEVLSVDEYSYDEKDRRRSSVWRTDTGDYRSEYAYNDAGQLEREVSTARDGELLNTTKYTYDDRGNRVKEERYPSGSDTDLQDMVFEYVYDDMGNLLREIEKTPDGRVGSIEEYTYDDDGKLQRQTVGAADGEAQRTYEYSYDDQGRMTRQLRKLDGDRTVDVTEFTYDANGNKVSVILKSADGSEVRSVHEYSY